MDEPATDDHVVRIHAAQPGTVTKDDSRYAAAYEEHFDFVWRNVRRLGVPEAYVDDAVQDVFLVVLRRLSDFEGRSLLRTWIFGIVTRVVHDHRRAWARQEARKVKAAAEPPRDAPPTPVEVMSRKEAGNALVDILNGMDEEKREVFVLVELEQMTVADVAAALKLNVNTAHARLRAARQQFEAGAVRFRARERR